MTGTLPACPNERRRMAGKIASNPSSGSDPSLSPRPSIDAARRRLGGRASPPSTSPPGYPVQATLRDGKQHSGVVLWSSAVQCDVWFDDGVARRLRADAVAPHAGPPPEDLARVAAEVRVFASLVEGERVRWQRSTGVVEGCIVEKCRYGAIVVTRDGKLIAVGFRRLWPAVVRGVA